MSEKNESSFGIMYNYALAEKSLENSAVNTPEFLLPLPDLLRLADEVGLDLVSAENFHEFYDNRATGTYVPPVSSLVACV